MSKDGSRDTKLEHLKKFFGELRDVDPDFTPQAMELLLWVSSLEKPTMSDLAERTGYSISGVNRVIAKLADKFNGKQGLGLLTADFDPGNYRQKLVSLTTKGNRFIERLLGYM